MRNDGFGRGNGGGSISSGGLNFTLNEDGASYSVAGIQEDTPADIVIVSELEGLPVTSIKNSAFANCSSLTSIVIPKGLISVYADAFMDCWSLRKVYYGGTQADWEKIKINGGNSNLSGNKRLTSATQYYYSSAEPDEAKWAESKYWWHYDPVTGEAVEWTKEE